MRIQEVYHESRRATMEYLRFIWECGRWCDMAISLATENGWAVAEIVRGSPG